MAEINSYAEGKALEAITLKKFKDINLKSIKDKLEIMLNEIGRNKLFSEYTMHNITHVDGMLKLLELIVPVDVKNIMTPTDWMMIVLSVYFHDLGMLITDDEFNKRFSNDDFNAYLNTLPKTEITKSVDYDRTIYQDFVRKCHGDRIYNWIMSISEKVHQTQPVKKFLYDMLNSLDAMILRDLAQLCKSHQEDLKEIYEDYEVDKQYEQDEKSCFNKLYVATLLRVADLLHINSERAPKEEFLLISPQNPYSRREWVKQKSINCIRPRKEKDRDGIVKEELEQHCFEIIGEFNDEDAFSHFQLYLDYAENELKTVYQICNESQKKYNNKYRFPWDEIDRNRIKTVGFSAKKLEFNLDKENILNLLIGHTLYNQTNVVLRELTQNALDAVRIMNYSSKEGDDNQARVEISWDSEKRSLTVSDNGTGMNENIILNYLFKVGASYYRSDEFQKDHPYYHSISRFGIGLLTCFMISDEIDIVTLHYTEKECHSIKIRNYNGQYYMRNDEKPDNIIGHKHGTTFTLKVRDNAKMEDLEQDLKQWVLVPEASVTLKIDDKTVNIGYASEKEALESFINTCGIRLESDKYKIETETIGCVTILILLHKNKIYNFWEPVYLSELHTKERSPVGIYVEGILVEPNSPGLKTDRIVSLVNCKGEKSPNTNVARDRMEGGGKMNDVYKIIYDSYLDKIVRQINDSDNTNSYSLTMSFAYSSIERLISNRVFSYELSSREIFDECLKRKDLFLLDNGEKWNLTSLDKLPSKICTIESRANMHAVNLLTEINRSPKTPIQLIRELYKSDQYKDIKNVLSDSFAENYLYDLFRQNYQITEIKCDKPNREYILVWERGRNPWLIINMLRFRHNPNISYVYLLKKGEEINFETDNSENVVITTNVMFLIGDNELFTVLNSIYRADNNESEDACSIAVNFVSKYILSEKTEKESFFTQYFSSNDNYLKDGIWNYIDKETLHDAFINTELIEINFKKYYMLFDERSRFF